MVGLYLYVEVPVLLVLSCLQFHVHVEILTLR
jgi:hypothetical protein